MQPCGTTYMKVTLSQRVRYLMMRVYVRVADIFHQAL
jgi:hypothetical protein